MQQSFQFRVRTNSASSGYRWGASKAVADVVEATDRRCQPSANESFCVRGLGCNQARLYDSVGTHFSQVACNAVK
jgi:hypothetical protein